MADKTYKFKRIELIKDLTIIEIVVSKTFELFGYLFGYLTIIPKLIRYHKVPNPAIFRQQSSSYAENGEIIYRNIGYHEPKAEDPNNFKSIAEFLQRSVARYPERRLAGTRPVISEKTITDPKTNKHIIKLTLGDIEWKTYKEFYNEVLKLAFFFRNNGYNREGKKMVFFAETCEDWLKMSFSMMFIASPYVTLYASLPDSSISYAINATEASSVFVDQKTYTRIATNIESFPNLEMIILSSKCSMQSHSIKNSKGNTIQILHINEILKITEVPKEDFKCESKLDDTALIMYTSGSTGTPKGVIITHENILSVDAIMSLWKVYSLNENLCYAGFLPMAHILELTMEHLIVRIGGRIGFGSPLTLITKGPMLDDDCPGDLTCIKPTIIMAVPLLLERIKKATFDELNKKSRLSQIIFQTAYNMKAAFLEKGYYTPILDALLFKKTKNIFGGNLEFGLVGGATLSIDTEEFSLICLGYLKQAYGMTETVCAGAMNEPNYLRPGNCGPPSILNELKLKAWDEGSYYPSDTTPRGEIMISGKCVSKGYYHDEKLTNEVFSVDEKTGKRWMSTGDIAEYQSDGTFKIIDRKKDIIKLSHGEYIPLAKIEKEILSFSIVELCCVVPNAESSHLVALIIPKRTSILQLAVDLNIPEKEGSFEEIVKNEKILSSLKIDLLNFLSTRLTKFEIPEKILFLEDIWTPESGLTTASMKVRRFEIVKRYDKLINGSN